MSIRAWREDHACYRKIRGLIKIRKLIYNLNPLAKKNQPRGIHMEISIRTVSHNSGNGGCFGLAAKIINADIPSWARQSIILR